MHTCVRMFVYTYAYTCVYIFMLMCIRMYVYINVYILLGGIRSPDNQPLQTYAQRQQLRRYRPADLLAHLILLLPLASYGFT